MFLAKLQKYYDNVLKKRQHYKLTFVTIRSTSKKLAVGGSGPCIGSIIILFEVLAEF